MLKGQLVQFNNQLHSLHEETARNILIKLVVRLEKEITQIESKMAELIDNERFLKEKMALIQVLKVLGN